jgi:tetratricopeptide (TPR) repeat protein/DNA-binding winged helix-turn-helix (wHTH) protein/TolB-like protein
MTRPHEATYRFAEVEVDPARACVVRDGQEIHLRAKTFQVLLYLLENPQRLVTKDELIEAVWKGTAVTDDALVKCISDVRKALGDDPRAARFVKTVSKGGYRFVGELDEDRPPDVSIVEVEEITTVEVEYEEEDSAAPAPRPLAVSAPARPARRTALVAALAVAALAATAALAYSARTRWSAGERVAADVVLPEVAGRRAVAVMYFENQSSDPELDWLREGLADMLITTLSNSKRATVLSRGQLHLLLERAGHADGEAIGLDEALAVARKSHADVLVSGSYGSLGGRVRIDVRLHDAGDGRLLASESLVVDEPGQILRQVDLLSLRVAARLGGAPDGARSLTEAMTNDLVAYRNYSLALERAQGMHNAEAIELLERAVAADPTFAMAHARIGYVYCMRWSFPDKARPHLEAAFRHADRLTDRDRLFIAAWYAVANADFGEAVRAFGEIVEAHPLETEAYVTLTRLLMGESRYAEAVEVARRGLAIDPEAGPIFNELGFAYLNLGQRDEAIEAFRRYAELEPGEPNAHDSVGLGYQWFGRYEEAVAAYERALTLDPDFDVALVHLGNAHAQTGRYERAAECYRRYTENVPSAGEVSWGNALLAELSFRREDRARGREAGRRSIASSEIPAQTAFYLAIVEGDLATAERLRRDSDQTRVADRGVRHPNRWRLWASARLALRRGQQEEAIRLLRDAVGGRPPIWTLDPLEDCLANGYLALGRIDEAIAEYERVLAINPRYPLARYRLGEAYERKGDAARAAEEYRRFLETWSAADADVPEVVAAKRKR